MKKMTAAIPKTLLAFIIVFSLFGSVASAHVTVTPKQSAPGAWETYTVKVPVEKETATTKFTLKIPSGVEFESYQPVAGWSLTLQKDANGKVTSITYEATGEGILPGQFQQFSFVAKNPEQAGKAAWDAYQFYKDGSIVEWTGDEGSKSPHSITDIVKATTANEMPGMSLEPAKETKKSESTAASSGTGTDSLATILSIVSVVLSFVALIFAVRKK